VAKAPRLSLPGLFLAFFLRVLSHLGYHPSLAYCSGCGKAVIGADGETHLLLTGDEVAFFPDRGGVLCPSCQVPGDYYIPISRSGYDKLAALQNGSLKEAAAMPIAYAETTRLLEALSRFLACQTDLKTDLKSLAFLEKLKNSTLAE
jgi:recombinational DNA repair protein (RecF pathway)